MAETPKTALDFMGQMVPPLAATQRREAALLNQQIRKEGGKFTVQPWDWYRYANKVKAERYDLDEIEEVDLTKYNHNHGADGKFSESPGAGGGGSGGGIPAVNTLGTMSPKELASKESRRDELWDKEDRGKITAKEKKELQDLETSISEHYSEKRRLMESGSSSGKGSGKFDSDRQTKEVQGIKGYVGDDKVYEEIDNRLSPLFGDGKDTRIYSYDLEYDGIESVGFFGADSVENGKTTALVTFRAKDTTTGEIVFMEDQMEDIPVTRN